MKIYYTTQAMKIGKHEWRMVVKDHYLGGRCTSFQFVRQNEFYWSDGREWPSYNINDGMYLGLPKSLRRLYNAHKDEINQALEVA